MNGSVLLRNNLGERYQRGSRRDQMQRVEKSTFVLHRKTNFGFGSNEYFNVSLSSYVYLFRILKDTLENLIKELLDGHSHSHLVALETVTKLEIVSMRNMGLVK